MEAATAAMTMTVVLVTLEEVAAPETGAAVWLVSVPSVTVAVTRLMALDVLEGFVEAAGVSEEAGACSTADGVADGADAEEGGAEEAELGGAEEALLGRSDDGDTDPGLLADTDAESGVEAETGVLDALGVGAEETEGVSLGMGVELATGVLLKFGGSLPGSATGPGLRARATGSRRLPRFLIMRLS